MDKTTTQGRFGKIQNINGGTVYSDPRDNPNFSGYIPPTTGPVNTINGQRLMGNNTPLTTPIIPPPTASTGLTAMAGSIRDQAITARDEEIKTYKENQKNQLAQATGLFAKLKLKPTERANEYESSGVFNAKKKVDDITSKMEARNLYYTRRIEDIQKNNPGGKFGGATEQEINQLNRDNAREQADLAISLSAETRNFTNLKSIVDAKVDAETEDLKTELDGLKFFYTQNENKLTDLQKEKTQEEITNATRAYEEAKSLRSDIGDVLKTAAQNGAPHDVISAIGNSQTLEDAYANAGSYVQKKSSDSNFTETQTNKGALNAGLDVKKFKALPSTVQNYYINSTAAQIKAMNEAISDVINGKQERQTVLDLIDSSNATQEVKDHLKSRIGDAVGGSSWWSKVKGYFGY